MKWGALFPCLFLISFAESKHLSRRYRDVEHVLTIARFIQVPESNLKFGTIAMLSQFVQHATFEEIDKVAKDILALAKVCDADRESEPRCDEYVGDICVDLLCREPDLAEKYNFIECCNAIHRQRYKCFLNQKNKPPESIPLLKNRGIKEICTKFKDNREDFQATIAHEIGRTYPVTSLYTIVKVVNNYGDVLTDCCEKTRAWPCFFTKTPVAAEKFRESTLDQHEKCMLEKRYKPGTLLHCKFAEMNKKFPMGSFSILYYLAGKVQYMSDELCQGNTLQDFIIKADILHDICTLGFKISDQLKDCCRRPIAEQPHCIEAFEEKDKPTDLSSNVKEFIEDKVLQCHTENTTNWAKHLILYEYSRGRPELSVEPITPLYKGYIDILHHCCQTLWKGMCGAEAENQLKTQGAEILNSKNDTCILYDSDKNFSYQDMLISEFTKRLPQLSFEELYQYSKKSAEGFDKCCHSHNSQKLICIEGEVDAVLGDICRLHNDSPINPQFGQCCNEPHHCRLMCFHSLRPNEHYFPVILNITFHEDFCSANPEKHHKEKLRFLVNLIKYKLFITKDEQRNLMMILNDLLKKCCQAEFQDECFRREGPKLLEKVTAGYNSALKQE